jgi:hypothetical protein
MISDDRVGGCTIWQNNPAVGMTKRSYMEAVMAGFNTDSIASNRIFVRLILSIDRRETTEAAIETVSTIVSVCNLQLLNMVHERTSNAQSKLHSSRSALLSFVGRLSCNLVILFLGYDVPHGRCVWHLICGKKDVRLLALICQGTLLLVNGMNIVNV